MQPVSNRMNAALKIEHQKLSKEIKYYIHIETSVRINERNKGTLIRISTTDSKGTENRVGSLTDISILFAARTRVLEDQKCGVPAYLKTAAVNDCVSSCTVRNASGTHVPPRIAQNIRIPV